MRISDWSSDVCSSDLIAAAAHVNRDPLAADEDLDRPRRQSRFNRLARIAVGHRVKMMCNLDMIIEAHAPGLPFGMNVRLSRQRRQQRRIELFEQLATGATKLAQHALVVEPCDQRCDRGIQLGKAVKYLVAQPPEQQPHDDPDTRLALGILEERSVGEAWAD